MKMETNRIILRPWRDSDAEVLYKWASDPDVGPRAGWAPHKSVEESLEIIRTVFNDALHTWAIVLKETGQPIGAMGYGPSCECDLPAREGEPLIGYWVAKPYWNQGICTEALRLMLDHIRETTDIKSLISGHFVDNPASGRVMEKCGFVPTGETCIDANQYQGANRPIRVLRLVIKTNIDKMIACCGINCEKCEARIATMKNDDKMRVEVAKKWCEMNHTDQITPESINCTGCRVEGIKFYFCSHMCEVHKCVTAKGYETCGDCPDKNTCKKVGAIWENCAEAKENLEAMRYREEAIECVKDHVLQIHKQIYAKYEGDFDRIYTEGYNSKSYTGRVIEPGKIYELSYLECTCPKVKCGQRNHPQQCECSRQSILYILSQLEPDSQFDVRIENTILRGSDRCTFRIMRLSRIQCQACLSIVEA